MSEATTILTPAQLTVRAFLLAEGNSARRDQRIGIQATARALAMNPGTVFNWLKKGQIPTKKQRLVLEKAKELGVELSAEDLIFGRIETPDS